MTLPALTTSLRPFTVAPLLVALLAACGGGGGDDSPAADTAVLSSAATAPVTTAPTAPTAPGTGAASAPVARSSGECLAAASFEKGYVETVRWRATDGSERLRRTTTLGPAARSGVATTEFRIEDLGTSPPTAARVYRILAGGDAMLQGTAATVRSNGVDITGDMTLTPPVPEGFALAPGESRSSGTVTARSVASAPGRPTLDTTSTAITSNRFRGFETVTVPAGTFVDACRIEVTTTTAGVASTSTTWYAKGLGLTLRVRNADGTGTDLVGAAIGDRVVAGSLVAATPAPVPTPAPAPGSGGAKR